MKTKIMISAFMILALTCMGKKHQGVYLTTADYQANKLSFVNESRVRLNNSIWNSNYITVVENHKKRKLSKSELFGYTSGNNVVYRFYNNDEYQLVESGNICIYKQTCKISQGKGYKVINKWFFSTTPGSAIMRLTTANIKMAYSDNEKLADLIELYFGNDDITSYDYLHKTFKVNYVYSKSLK